MTIEYPAPALLELDPAHACGTPDCGACPGDGSICPDTCKLAEESPPIIGPNELEQMAKARPNDKFLKGSGVLKLLGAIRNLESQVRSLTAYQAEAMESVREECKRVVHNAIHDAILNIDDCEPVKAAVRAALDGIDVSEFGATPAEKQPHSSALRAALVRLLDSDQNIAKATDAELQEAAGNSENPELLREQAAAVLQARAALAGAPLEIVIDASKLSDEKMAALREALSKCQIGPKEAQKLELVNPDLHSAIMNLPCIVPAEINSDAERTFYRIGHRAARHAASELAAGGAPVSQNVSVTDYGDMPAVHGLHVPGVLEMAAHYTENGMKSTILAAQIRRITPALIAQAAPAVPEGCLSVHYDEPAGSVKLVFVSRDSAFEFYRGLTSGRVEIAPSAPAA